MLKISLVAVGDKMPPWVDQGFAEYAKRVRGRMSLNLVAVTAVRRGKNADMARVLKTEEDRLRRVIPAPARVVALDRDGDMWSTPELADRLLHWADQGQALALVVGGPEGLSRDFIRQCDESWSLSALTFAHPLVRVMLAEQLYRCFSIIENKPYHR